MSALRIHVKKLFAVDVRSPCMLRPMQQQVDERGASVVMCLTLDNGEVVRRPIHGHIGSLERAGFYRIVVPLPEGAHVTAVHVDRADGATIMQYDTEEVAA